VHTSGLDGDLARWDRWWPVSVTEFSETVREVFSVAPECGATRITLQLRADN